MFHYVAGEQTPLMLAAKADHVDVMRALVAGGADAKLKAQDGTTVLSAAAGSGHLDAVQYAYELESRCQGRLRRHRHHAHARRRSGHLRSAQRGPNL